MGKLYQGKRVVITGPAPSVLLNRISANDFDVFVRINNMVPISKPLADATSDRCDVWYPANALLRSNPELCLLPQVKCIRVSKKAKAFVPAEVQHKVSLMNSSKVLSSHLKFTANRGLKAITDIALEKPSVLYITGFTFYTGEPYYNGYTSDVDFVQSIKDSGGQFGNHHQGEQLQFFKKFIASLPFVKMDDALMQIVSRV